MNDYVRRVNGHKWISKRGKGTVCVRCEIPYDEVDPASRCREWVPNMSRFRVTSGDVDFLTALKLASPDQYAVLRLTLDDPGIPRHEGAAQLGICVSTFKTRLHRARTKIVAWRKQKHEHERRQEIASAGSSVVS